MSEKPYNAGKITVKSKEHGDYDWELGVPSVFLKQNGSQVIEDVKYPDLTDEATRNSLFELALTQDTLKDLPALGDFLFYGPEKAILALFGIEPGWRIVRDDKLYKGMKKPIKIVQVAV